MLRALVLDDVEQLVCAPPPNPRALDPHEIAAAAVDLGFPEDRIDVVDSVAAAISSALLTTSADGEIVVTGSLYFVGAARGILVDD